MIQEKKELSFPTLGKHTVTFPKVGQMIEIEQLKISISGGMYNGLLSSFTKRSIFVLDMIDSIATFSVLIPGFQKQLGVKGYSDLDPTVGKELAGVYRDQFLPWYGPMEKELYTDQDDNDDKKMEEDTKQFLQSNTSDQQPS